MSRRVAARLDQRLDRHRTEPAALALSGGGDSAALLALAAAWAKGAGRRLLALTVDHGLNPDSAAWTRRAEGMARAAGADWRGLTWDEAEGGPGVQARARAARHALIAKAAREAGARVVLFAHTADDIAEADWMRARGSTLGRLREWSPSPAWPEGRELMLMRPLLDVRRAELRAWLEAQDLDWIDDPANLDARFARSRARAELAGGEIAAGEEAAAGPAAGSGAATAALNWAGVADIERTADARTVAMALLCAGGGSVPPRGDRLARLMQRLAQAGDFTAGLAGARIEAARSRVRLMREPGDLRRRPPAVLRLEPHEAGVWDGRFEIAAGAVSGRVEAAQGRLNLLPPEDRRIAAALPPAARGALPVFIRDGGDAPLLAWRPAGVRSLGPRRLALALGETTQESDLFAAPHGETPPSDLFSLKDFRIDPAGTPPSRI